MWLESFNHPGQLTYIDKKLYDIMVQNWNTSYKPELCG